jgi:hypothetical protein
MKIYHIIRYYIELNIHKMLKKVQLRTK